MKTLFSILSIVISLFTFVGRSNTPSLNIAVRPSDQSSATTESAVQSAPMHEVPYTTSLSASTAIYATPDNSTYVRTVGQDGIYTITEEAYDSAGNLWGKLKSGLGWVLLSEASVSTTRTCPQCGQSEPDAIFMEDWQPGDLCFGCSYNSQGGGSDDKLICSQCGADCTYRGLEEDGRCEDCHNNG